MMSKMLNPNAPSRKRRANESNGPHVPNPAWNTMSEDYVDAYAEHDYRESHLNNRKPENVAKTLAAIDDLQKRYRGHAASAAFGASGRGPAGSSAIGQDLPQLSKLAPAAREVVREQFHFVQALDEMRYTPMSRDDAREMLKMCGLETQVPINDPMWTCAPVHYQDQELVTDRDNGDSSEEEENAYDKKEMDDEPVERALVRLGNSISTTERDEELETLLEDHFRVEVELDEMDDGTVAVARWFVVLI